jgi:hypothetical protein
MKHRMKASEKAFNCLKISLLGSLLSMVTIGSLWAWRIPDTGQTKCYNNFVEIPFLHPGSPFMVRTGTKPSTRPPSPS